MTTLDRFHCTRGPIGDHIRQVPLHCGNMGSPYEVDMTKRPNSHISLDDEDLRGIFV